MGPVSASQDMEIDHEIGEYRSQSSMSDVREDDTFGDDGEDAHAAEQCVNSSPRDENHDVALEEDPVDEENAKSRSDAQSSGEGCPQSDHGCDTEKHTSMGDDLPSEIPFLHMLHHPIVRELHAQIIDGKAPRLTREQLKSQWCPFKNYSTMLLAMWAISFPSYVSRRLLKGLVAVLKTVVVDGDGNEHHFDPTELPESIDHFADDARRALPLLPVYEYPVPRKGGDDSERTVQAVMIPLNAILARELLNPHVMTKMKASQGGRTIPFGDHEDNGMVDYHLLPVPTKRADGASRSYLEGRYTRRSSVMGIERIRGGDRELLYIGDTVLARILDDINEGEPFPATLVGLFLDESRSTQDSPAGRVVAEVRPFCFPQEVVDGGERAAASGIPRLWECTDEEDIKVVDIDALECRCFVSPIDVEGVAPDREGDSNKSFVGAGFVRRRKKHSKMKHPRKPFEIVSRPWDRRGDQGKTYDMRGSDVHRNAPGRAIVKTPLWVYSDAFNAFTQGGTQCSVNATYAGFGCCGQQYERRLNGSYLCSLAGPGGEWQQEHLPLAKIIGALQRGCRAFVVGGPTTKKLGESSQATIGARIRGTDVSAGGPRSERPIQKECCNTDIVTPPPGASEVRISRSAMFPLNVSISTWIIISERHVYTVFRSSMNAMC